MAQIPKKKKKFTGMIQRILPSLVRLEKSIASHQISHYSWHTVSYAQGRIKASVGPGAVPNVGPLQTYNST